LTAKAVITKNQSKNIRVAQIAALLILGAVLQVEAQENSSMDDHKLKAQVNEVATSLFAGREWELVSMEVNSEESIAAARILVPLEQEGEFEIKEILITTAPSGQYGFSVKSLGFKGNNSAIPPSVRDVVRCSIFL